MDPMVWYYFSDELQQDMSKEAVSVGDIASGGVEAAKRFGKAFGHSAAGQVKALDPRNVASAFKGLRGERALSTMLFSGGAKSTTPQLLRQAGWLADFKPTDMRGAGKVLQYLPGQKPLAALQAGMAARKGWQDTEDSSGRKRGVGERAGRALAGGAMSMAGSHAVPKAKGLSGFVGGALGGTVGGMAGAEIGGAAGRGLDASGRGAKAVGQKLRGPRDKEKTPALKVTR